MFAYKKISTDVHHLDVFIYLNEVSLQKDSLPYQRLCNRIDHYKVKYLLCLPVYLKISFTSFYNYRQIIIIVHVSTDTILNDM